MIPFNSYRFTVENTIIFSITTPYEKAHQLLLPSHHASQSQSTRSVLANRQTRRRRFRVSLQSIRQNKLHYTGSKTKQGIKRYSIADLNCSHATNERQPGFCKIESD